MLLSEATSLFVKLHRRDNIQALALKGAPPGVDLKQALQQIKGWQKACGKIPSWAENENIIYPSTLALEQCSSEATARYKQRVVQTLLSNEKNGGERTFVDFTGGFGVDFSFLSVLFDKSIYTERQEDLCQIAAHNFHALGLQNVWVRNEDSSLNQRNWIAGDFCFIDPARRDKVGRKMVAVNDCEPDVAALQEDLRKNYKVYLIKLSPMLDIQAALNVLDNVAQVHVVAVEGECKELLVVMNRQKPEQTTFHAVNINNELSEFKFTREEELSLSIDFTSTLGRYIYEPNAAILKLNCLRSIAKHFNLSKLHPNSHLYTSDQLHTGFPGRVFVVENSGGFGKKDIHKLVGDIQQANLTVRNFPQSVVELRKRLKLREGGDIFIFATTNADGHHIIIRCRRIDSKK